MKVSNFQFTKYTGNGPSDWEVFATIDVKPFFGKKVTREIRKEYIGHWHFVDNGKFTPNMDVEELARSWEAKNGKMLPKYL